MSQAERYIEKYKELENLVRETYQLSERDSISYFLTHQNRFAEIASEIRYCQDVRNLLQHRQKIEQDYPVEPSEAMLHFLDQLMEKIRGRVPCMTIARKTSEIYSSTLDGNVLQTIQDMHRCSYTQVPILEQNRVIGLFDSRSLFSFLAENHEKNGVDDHTTFRDIQNYLTFDKSATQIVGFYPSTLYTDELEEEFEKKYRQGKRIIVAFLTDHGRSDEALRGMITPWDLLGT